LKRWEELPAGRPDGLASSKEEKAEPCRARNPEVSAVKFREGLKRKKREGREKVETTFS
jgi:hypothetical protein